MFDNLQKIPFASARYALTWWTESNGGPRTRRDRHCGVRPPDRGVDSVPVEESYKWTVQRHGANGPLKVTAIAGASSEHNYPAPWDAVAGLTVFTRPKVVIMADDTSVSFAKSHADAMERDAEYDFAHWTGGLVSCLGSQFS